MLGALADQPEAGRVPKGTGSPMSEHNLVPRRQVEQIIKSLLHARDEIAHRRLAMGGPQWGIGRSGERGNLFRANLGGTGAEAAVTGLEVSRDFDCKIRVRHISMIPDRALALGRTRGL